MISRLLSFPLILLSFIVSGLAAASQDKPEIFVQLGHSGGIHSVAFSPDGRTVVSGSSDKTLRLWDTSSGRELRVLEGHTGRVNTVAFSPDGRVVISGSNDGTLKRWDVASGREMSTLRVHPHWISSDGRIVVSKTKNHVLNLRDATSGRELASLHGHTGLVNAVAISPDGRTIVSGGDDKTIRFWDIASGREHRLLRGHADRITAIAFSPDGRTVVSGDDDSILRLWDTASFEFRDLRGHSDGINAVAFAPDGRTLVSGAGDNSLKLWDVVSGREIKTLRGHTDRIHAVAFAPDGRTVVSGGLDKTLKRWGVPSGRGLQAFRGNNKKVHGLAASPDGRMAVSGDEDGMLILWDVASGREIKTLRGHKGRVYAVAFSPGGHALASAGDDKTLRFWDVASGREIRTLSHDKIINSVAFSPDGRIVLSGSDDKYFVRGAVLYNADDVLKLWDVATGRELKTLKGHASSVNAATFSPDGRTLVSAGDDKTIKLWDVASGRELRTLRGHGGAVGSVAFSPDGRTVASSSADRTLKLWDIASGRELSTLSGHTGLVVSVVFTPDGRSVVSGSTDNTLKLWAVATGRELQTFRGHLDLVRNITLLPNGRNVISSSWDGAVRLWDIASGQERVRFISFEGGEWIVITPEGYYDASEQGDRHLNVRVGNKVYGVDQYRERFYRPDLVKLALAGKPLTGLATLGSVKPAPSVSIVETSSSVNRDEVTVKVRVVDRGGGIGDVRLYLNGSAVSLERRNLSVAATAGTSRVFSYPVQMVAGKNSLRAIAFNADNSMQSTDALHEIEASIEARRPSLYAVVVGIQDYQNPVLNLRYSLADANLFANTLRQRNGGLYSSVTVITLTTPSETTNTALITALKTARAKVRPEDLFVFYVASHGTVDEGEYYLITSNVGSTSTEKLKRDALSQNTLKELIANVPATKKLIVLDTCNAGRLGDTLQVAMLTRGMSEDTAVKILSRAVGSTILSAATSQQEAVEGYNNHGLFTWVLVQGLNGDADTDKDGYVKTLELASYVDDRVPELAEKVFKHKQFPVVSPSGQAFPLVRVR